MAAGEVGMTECKRCGEGTDIESATKIIVERDDEQVWTVLCPDCATVDCPNCGVDVRIGAVIEGEGDIWASTELLACSRCEERTPIEDVVELRNEHDKGYRRRLCADCLEEIAVPPGYRVVRDITPTS